MGSIKKLWELKYGEEEANKKWEEFKIKSSKSKTLEGYIEKYGIEIGTQKYKEKNSKLSVGKKSLENRGYTEKEIEEIKSKHSNSSHHGLDNYIYRFGLEEGLKKYQDYCESRKKLSPRTLEYWILKNNGDIAKSKTDLKNFQTRDLKFYINLYGETEGIEKYKNYCNSKISWNKENYNEFVWEDMNKKRNKKRKSFSSAEIFIYNFIKETISSEFKIYGGESVKNKYVFFIDDDFYKSKLNKSALSPDIYIPEKKLIIEYYGDLYHANPIKYLKEDLVPVLNCKAEQVWEHDLFKNKFYESKGLKVIVVWENDFIKNKEEILKELINEINK